MSDQLFQQLIDSIVLGKVDEAGSLTQKALDQNIAAMTTVEKALIPAMAIVSEKYEKKEYYLPQMLISSDAFYAAFDLLKEEIKAAGAAGGKAKIVCGVVEGDVHDIGKNLVKTVLEANGFICVDMGRDVPVEDYLDAVAKEKPDFLLLSTLMTPTMLSMKRTVEGLSEEGTREGVKVMIGGGPISWDFAKKIGADFYGDNEKEALRWANSEVEK
ncbi:MAG: corrinoid protein [Deltaproteobacteria bacterium]|nr:corrinoid protein [Deltaproteobacteria bacterium]